MQTLDLTITFKAAPARSTGLARWRAGFAGFEARGTLPAILSERERADLQWYLEDYPLWPFAEFATRG